MMLGKRTISIAGSIALHAALLLALWQLDSVRKPLLDAVPLIVHLITPPKPEPPPPREVIPVNRLPVARHAVPRPAVAPPQILAVESTLPSPVSVPPQPKVEPAPVAIEPAPKAPPRIVPPSFDAAYLRNSPPGYPPLSKRRGERGTVMLRVFVNAEGDAEKVLIRASSGYDRLDQAAHDAVHQWRFVPARQGDRPVAAWVLVPVVFALGN